MWYNTDYSNKLTTTGYGTRDHTDVEIGKKERRHVQKRKLEEGQIAILRHLMYIRIEAIKTLYELMGAFNASFGLYRHRCGNSVLLREVGKNTVENSDNGIMVDWRVGISFPRWKDSISEDTEPREEWFEVRRHLLYDRGFKNLHMRDFLAAHLFICAFKLTQVKPLSHWGALLSYKVGLRSPTIVRPFEHCCTKESDIHQ